MHACICEVKRGMHACVERNARMRVSVDDMTPKKSAAAIRVSQQLEALLQRHEIKDAKALAALTEKIGQSVDYTTINRIKNAEAKDRPKEQTLRVASCRHFGRRRGSCPTLLRRHPTGRRSDRRQPIRQHRSRCRKSEATSLPAPHATSDTPTVKPPQKPTVFRISPS